MRLSKSAIQKVWNLGTEMVPCVGNLIECTWKSRAYNRELWTIVCLEVQCNLAFFFFPCY